MNRITIVFGLMLIASLIFSQTVVIKGTILGADGKPLLSAHVHMVSNLPGDTKVISQTELSAMGNFMLRFNSPALVRLKFTGVNHYSLEIPFLCENTDTINFSVKLRAYDINDPLDNPYVIGDFNNFEVSDDGNIMTKQQDGIFTASVNAVADDTLGFQIMGVEKNGLPYTSYEAEKYVYDRSNTYRSVIRTQGGATQVSFDPSRVLRITSEAVVKFQNDKSLQAKFYAIHKNLLARQDRYQRALNDFVATGKPASDYNYDWSKDLSSAKKARQTEVDATLKNVWLLAAIEYGGMKKDTSLAVAALTSVSPTSPLWSYFPKLLMQCYDRLSNKSKYLPYVEKIINGHPDQEIKPLLISQLLDIADAQKDTQIIISYYQKLVDEFDNTEWLEKAKSKFEPNPIIKVGGILPEFVVPSIDDTSLIDNKRLAGGYWLINFWATWNSASVKEIDNISQVYENYKGKGLNVLSISLDESVEKVTTFRKSKNPMPWLNTFVENSVMSNLAKQFEVLALPKIILVGTDGKIVALGDETRGKKLPETLEKALGK